MRTKLLTAIAALGFAAMGSTVQAERLTDAPLVDAAWLQQHLGNDSLVVLDVRDAVDNVVPYTVGHIPGSISAPYSSSGWRQELQGVPGQFPGEDVAAKLIGDLGISNDDHVVIVPQGTDASEFGAATRIYWTFKVLGHDAVSILNGGARAWTSANGELTAEATTLQPTTFNAQFRQDLLASTADVQAALADGTALIDGRPAAQYRGEAKSPVVRVAGTIPGSVNLENGLLYSADNASFANADVVAQFASGLGVDADEKNIVFCNTGHWASIVWFGLSEVQGNKNTRMYDGSMAEWAADESRPVANGS
jgi:thiosulfate/3-mercaptopyruvate sulfurtransferase